MFWTENCILSHLTNPADRIVGCEVEKHVDGVKPSLALDVTACTACTHSCKTEQWLWQCKNKAYSMCKSEEHVDGVKPPLTLDVTACIDT